MLEDATHRKESLETAISNCLGYNYVIGKEVDKSNHLTPFELIVRGLNKVTREAL